MITAEYQMTSHFDLPPVEAREIKPKREGGDPDISILKEQQRVAFDLMWNFLMRDGGGYFLLKGYAGTGKTFTISRLIEKILFMFPEHRIAFTAPTNKAVKELYKAAEYKHTNQDFLTIHRLLGLKEQINKDGHIEFKPDFKFPPSIVEKTVLIIDEVSMLQDDLFEMIDRYVPSNELKVILMGDPAQIPPVGRVESLALTEAGQLKHGIEVYTLTDIQRQALDNPIIETTFKIRNSIGRPVSFPSRESKLLDNGSGVLFIDRQNKDEGYLFTDVLEKYFTSENFKQDSDFCKIIAWRNATVGLFNDIVRKMIYKQKTLPRIMEGEKLIANGPIFEQEYIIFSTNDEMEVISYTEDADDINNGMYSIRYYKALVKYRTPDNIERKRIINIVHGDSMETYKTMVDMLRKAAISKVKGSWEASSAWEDYYLFQQRYADVGYNYAITGHKSQGSTYGRVFVLEGDINFNRNIVERNRIKYTACSRPKHQLFIVN